MSNGPYVLIEDGSFTLDAELNHQNSFEFFVNSDLATGKYKDRAILGYNARPLSDNASLQISVFGDSPTTIETINISENTVRALWEAFPAGKLNAGEDNSVTFVCTEGEIRISDVILWYQRDLELD